MTRRTPEKNDWHADDWRADLDERIKAAVANGTHSATPPRVVCQACREYCDGFLHKTFDGQMVGACCTPRPILDAIAESAARRKKGAGA